MNDFLMAAVAKPTADAIAPALSKFFGFVGSTVKVSQARFIEDFRKYCTYMHEKNSRVRSLISKNKPLNLLDVYQPAKFRYENGDISQSTLIERFSRGGRIIVKGNGGSGKTFFLKYLWLHQFHGSSGKIPIFIELRRLSDVTDPSLAAFCKHELQSSLLIEGQAFEVLCADGRFDFIFDGFDEVSRERRKTIEKQIIDLSDKYPKCNFLVSGREDDRFSSWGSFHIYSVAPLSMEDTRSLIERIPFDSKVKKKFLEVLDKNFYETHQSFLSSPLLSIMMLMTFNENAIIPEKLTTFYDHAFQTLLTWHDATKDSFDRERVLGIDVFRRVFSTFCLISYYDQQFEFTENRLRQYLKKSLDYHKVTANVEDVHNDICEAVNLLQRDGLVYVFVHRSFQEYFAAECVTRVISGKAGEFLSVFAQRRRDSVFFMCFQLHPELVYDAFLGDKIRELLNGPILTDVYKRHFSVFSALQMEFEFILIFDNGSCRMLGVRRWGSSNPEIEASLDLMDLVASLSENYKGDSVRFSAMMPIFTSISQLGHQISSDNTSSVNSVELLLKISLEQDRNNISMRHQSKEKLAPLEISRLRAKIKEELSKIKMEIKKDTIASLKKCSENLLSIIEAREMKEKSIDKLLGI